MIEALTFPIRYGLALLGRLVDHAVPAPERRVVAAVGPWAFIEDL